MKRRKKRRVIFSLHFNFVWLKTQRRVPSFVKMISILLSRTGSLRFEEHNTKKHAMQLSEDVRDQRKHGPLTNEGKKQNVKQTNNKKKKKNSSRHLKLRT
jgi:hypothetical protein